MPQIASFTLALLTALGQCADAYEASRDLETGVAAQRRRLRHRDHPLRDVPPTSLARDAIGQLAIRCTATALRAHRDRLTLTRWIVCLFLKIAMGKLLMERTLIPPRRGAVADVEEWRRRALVSLLVAGARQTPPAVTPTLSSSTERANRRGD